jgi:hypothetical protein
MLVQTEQRRAIGRCRYHNCAREPFQPQVVLDEFLHFPAAFADQPDDNHVGLCVSRHHREQTALADAAAGE